MHVVRILAVMQCLFNRTKGQSIDRGEDGLKVSSGTWEVRRLRNSGLTVFPS
jgi:hypothetical protein